MHKENPYLKANRKKLAHFKKLLFCQKTFLASNFFMQMFNESILCRQSIELFRHKLWYKLNSPHMHYLYKCHTKLLSYRWMDELVFYVPSTVFSVISRRWKGEHERLCAMKRRLGSGRISPPAGFEPATRSREH